MIGAVLYSISDDDHSVKSKITSLFTNDASNQPLEECSSQFIITGSYFICRTLLIPFHELIIHPLFYRCLPKANRTYKFMTGVILRLGKLIAQLIILVTFSRKYNLQTEDLSNGTLPCLLYESSGVSGTYYINYTWNIFLEVLSVVSDLLIYIIGTLEFLCAQVPYSMKGLVAGTAYALLVIYVSAFSKLQQFYEKKIHSLGKWSDKL